MSATLFDHFEMNAKIRNEAFWHTRVKLEPRLGLLRVVRCQAHRTLLHLKSRNTIIWTTLIIMSKPIFASWKFELYRTHHKRSSLVSQDTIEVLLGGSMNKEGHIWGDIKPKKQRKSKMEQLMMACNAKLKEKMLPKVTSSQWVETLLVKRFEFTMRVGEKLLCFAFAVNAERRHSKGAPKRVLLTKAQPRAISRLRQRLVLEDDEHFLVIMLLLCAPETRISFSSHHLYLFQLGV